MTLQHFNTRVFCGFISSVDISSEGLLSDSDMKNLFQRSLYDVAHPKTDERTCSNSLIFLSVSSYCIYKSKGF